MVDALASYRIDAVQKEQEAKKANKDATGKDQFLTMLVAQLENQDPLNPQDSAQFSAQLAQFSTVEQLIAMRAGIDKLVNVSSTPTDGGSRAANLDPASLIGREVTVFGSQIEVDEKGSPIELPLRLKDTAVTADVKITDASGKVRYQGSILKRDESDRPIALRPGDSKFAFDPAAHGLEKGVYKIEFKATGTDDEPVTILPMVTGLVTGAVVAGDPAIRIGSRLFAVDDVLEIRMAQTALGNPS